jgi:hypothetical protein
MSHHLTGWKHHGTCVFFGDGGVSTHACGDNQQQQIERARLMAAAPILLKACRQAIIALKGREHDGFLRDAIKAATGDPHEESHDPSRRMRRSVGLDEPRQTLRADGRHHVDDAEVQAMNHRSRINLGDGPSAAVIKLCEGNPGAADACSKLLIAAPSVDPDSAFGSWGPLFHLDTLGIYGSRIHDLFKYVAEGDAEVALMLLRAVQLGHLSAQMLDAWIDRRRSLGDNLDHLRLRVMADLPRFGRNAGTNPDATKPVGE